MPRRSLLNRQNSRPERSQEQVDFGLRVESPQTDANQSSRTFFVVAHSKQATRWLSRTMCAAGAARRHRYTGLIEQRKQSAHFSFLPTETETQMTGQALCWVSEEICVWKHLQNLRSDALTKSSKARSFLLQFLLRNLGCHAEADNARDVLSCRSQPAFLPAAEHCRRELHSLANVERANTLWPMELVRRER